MIDIEKLAEEYSQRAYDMGDKRLNDKLAFCDGANAMLAENARLRPLLTALADVASAAKLRSYHDDDCADATEKFKPHEMCECGASVAKQALAALEKLLEEGK